MASLRKGTATVAPEWEVKAKRELAIWRQHQKIARAIAQADIVQCATKRWLAVEQLKHHDFAKAALSHQPTASCVKKLRHKWRSGKKTWLQWRT